MLTPQRELTTLNKYITVMFKSEKKKKNERNSFYLIYIIIHYSTSYSVYRTVLFITSKQTKNEGGEVLELRYRS